LTWHGWKKRYPIAFLFLLACLPIFIVGSYLQKRTHVSASQVEVRLGYQNADNADRAAMQTIAEAVRAHPHVPRIIVYYSTTWLYWVHLDDEIEDVSVTYDRRDHLLQWYSGDGTSAGPWLGVTDQIVNRVAETRGGIGDVNQFGARWGGI
jgi:hypothetical protein